MTRWDLYVLTIIVVYLLAFFIRNIKSYSSLKTSIRGRSTKLTFSLALSTLIYLITFVNILFPDFHIQMGEISLLESSILRYIGYGLIFLAFVIGLAALYEMQNSWRVGIAYDQKTDLITTGMYSISRNPYFLSYNILFTGIFLIYPSLTLLILIVALVIIFHLMIREEEKYLDAVLGESYQNYKKRVSRYIFFV